MLLSFAWYVAQLAFKWLFVITRLFKYNGRFLLVLFAVAKSCVSV